MKDPKSRIDTEESQIRIARVETTKAGTGTVFWTVHWAMRLNDELRDRIVEGEWIAADLEAWARIWAKHEAELQSARDEAERENDHMLARWRAGVERAEDNGWPLPERPPAISPREVEKPKASKSRRDLPSLLNADFAGAINWVNPTTHEMAQMVLVMTTLRSTPRAEIEGLEAWLHGKSTFSGDWSEHAQWCRLVGMEGLQFSTTQLNLPGIEELPGAGDEGRRAAIDRLFERTEIQLSAALKRFSGDPALAGAALAKQVDGFAIGTPAERATSLAAFGRVLAQLADDTTKGHKVCETARIAFEGLRALQRQTATSAQIDIEDLGAGEINARARDSLSSWAKSAGVGVEEYIDAAFELGIGTEPSAFNWCSREEHVRVLDRVMQTRRERDRPGREQFEQTIAQASAQQLAEAAVGRLATIAPHVGDYSVSIDVTDDAGRVLGSASAASMSSGPVKDGEHSRYWKEWCCLESPKLHQNDYRRTAKAMGLWAGPEMSITRADHHRIKAAMAAQQPTA